MDNLDQHNHDGQQTGEIMTNVQAKNPNTVILDEPIKRGNTKITEVTVSQPTAGALRGASLQAIADLDVIALQRILPRITNPTIHTEELAKMSPADLMQLGMKVAIFLLPTADRAMVSPSE